jgi:hypothetical protein
MTRESGHITRRVAATAVPHLLVAAVVPTVCFLVGRDLWGLPGAIGLALGWNWTCQAIRWARGCDWSGLLLLGSISLIIRAVVALALHSAQVFLIAPALVTLAMGAVYVATAFSSTPLLGRVIGDLVPASVLDTSDPRVDAVVRKASIIYGVEQWLSALMSIVMVVNMGTTTYVAVHEFASFGVLLVVAAVALPFLIGPVRAATCPLGAITPPVRVITPPDAPLALPKIAA